MLRSVKSQSVFVFVFLNVQNLKESLQSDGLPNVNAAAHYKFVRNKNRVHVATELFLV
jgi:hypothetical protein